MSRYARCDMLVSGIVAGQGAAENNPGCGGCPASQHIGVTSASRVPARARLSARMSPRMSTRTLLILAAVTGVAILTAGAVQILLAR